MKSAVKQVKKQTPVNRCRPRPKDWSRAVVVQQTGGALRRQSQSWLVWRAQRRFWPCAKNTTSAVAQVESTTVDSVQYDGDLRDAHEAWLCTEDIWERLSHLCKATVSHEGDSYQISFANFRRQIWCGPQLALRYAVLDTDQYRWQSAGHAGNFVTLIEYQGDDLVIALGSLARMKRWTDGESIQWQVLGFLGRVRRECWR